MTGRELIRQVGRARPVRILQLLSLGALAVGTWGMVTAPGADAQQRASSSGGVTGTSGNTGSAATNANTFSLSALANSLDVLVSDSSLPLSGDLAYELGPWGASAAVSSLGQSMADAGAPYSPSVDDLPGTVNGIGAGDLPPIPPIPGYVSASYPNIPTKQETQAGYQISSSASENTAKGSVSLGVQPSGSPNSTLFATAQTTANSDGSVSSSATAGMDALDFGQLLDLGNVSSSLTMTQQADQQPKVTSQTTLGTVTLLGNASGLVGSSLSVLGIGVPIDLNDEVISSLDTALAPTGIKLTGLPVTYQYTDGSSSTGGSPQTSKTLRAVDSGALQVSVSQNIPSQGPVTVTMTLGRVYITTTNTSGFATTGNTGTVGNTGAAAAVPPSSSSVVGNTGTVAATTPAPLTSSTTSPSTTIPSSSTPRVLAAGPAYAIDRGPPVESVYLVLVLAAIAMLLASQAIRYLAVRLVLRT